MTSAPGQAWPPLFTLYRALTRFGAPLLRRMARNRHQAMGAAPGRLPERFGISHHARPAGPVVWINAASMGELRAALAIVDRLRDVFWLVTTTSQSSAEMAARTLPDNALHQFAPLDTPATLARFLDHWRPDLVLFLESDLPFRVIDRLAREGVPMALLNARPSRTRERLPRMTTAVLSRMAVVSAQDAETAGALCALGLREDQLAAVTDLKSHAPPPPPQESAVSALRRQIAGRPVWLAMSAHPEEAGVIARAHRDILAHRPDCLLILAPRHPERIGAFDPALQGLSCARRGGDERIRQAQVYVADTLGEAGTLFAVSPFALIGGTLAPIGGHSPQEALRAGRPVLFGPHPGAHAAAFETARMAGAARQVDDAPALAQAVSDWLTPDALAPAQAAVQTLAGADDRIIDDLVGRLRHLIG